MSKVIKLKELIISIVIPLLVGGLSSLFSMNGFKEFEAIRKPAFTPPGIVFPIAWTILYILMGIGSYLVYMSNCKDKYKALRVYSVQLFFNFLWSILFFSFKLYWLAFVWLIVLMVLIALMIYRFYNCNKTAGLFQIPYFLWVTFAGVLNAFVAVLN